MCMYMYLHVTYAGQFGLFRQLGVHGGQVGHQGGQFGQQGQFGLPGGQFGQHGGQFREQGQFGHQGGQFGQQGGQFGQQGQLGQNFSWGGGGVCTKRREACWPEGCWDFPLCNAVLLEQYARISPWSNAGCDIFSLDNAGYNVFTLE